MIKNQTESVDSTTKATIASYDTIASIEISPEDNDTTLPLFETNIPNVCCAYLASIITGGTAFAFGLYGSALKHTLHLTQSQLDTISTAKFCAGLFIWIPGMFVDRCGARIGITLGGICVSVILMLEWAVATQIITIQGRNANVLILSFLSVATFFSGGLIVGAVFRSISCSCGPGTKGSAVGIAKGYVGLGTGAFACLFESIRSPTSSDLDFLPMAAIFYLVGVAIPGWCFMKRKPVVDVLTPLHFRVLYISLFCLAVIVVGTSLLNLYEEEHTATLQEETDVRRKPNYVMAGSVMAVWIGPLVAQLFLPQKRLDASAYYTLLEKEEKQQKEGYLFKNKGGNHSNGLDSHNGDGDDKDSPSMQTPFNIEDQPDEEPGTGSELSGPKAVIIHDKNLFQMIKDPSAWVILWIAAILVGGGTVETNNMGQMVESLGFPPVVTSVSLALFSVFQSGGRIFIGVISDKALNWDTHRCCIDRGVPRPFFLVVISLIGFLAHTILAVSTDQFSFVVGVSLSGISFGGTFTMLVLMADELFGKTHVATNYTFYDGVSSAVGTFFLSKVIAQEVYESHINNGDPGEVTCYGQECFQFTHIIISILCLTCVAMSYVVIHNTRHVYNNTLTAVLA